MKKLIGVLVVAAGAYLALTYYGGYAGEKALRQQVEQNAAQGELHGYEVTLVSYERGLTSSRTVMEMRFDLAHVGLEELNITSTSQIQHGPFLFTAQGPKLGLFAATSEVDVVSSNEDVNQLLADLFAEGLGEILMIGHFDQSYSAYMDLPNVDHALAGGLLKVDSGSLVMRGDSDGRHVEGKLELGAAYFNDGDSVTVMLSPSSLDFDVHTLDDLVNYEGLFNYHADSMTLSSAGAPEIVLGNLGVLVTQELVNERLDSRVAFTVGEVHGSPIATKNFIYELGFKQVPPAAIVAWQELARDIQKNPAEADFSEFRAELMAVLELLLQEGLEFSLRLGADILEGEADINLVANYVGMPGDRSLSDVEDMMDYFSIADADLEIKVSESVVMQTPLYFMLAQYLETYFSQEGEHLIMRASLKGGQLNIADQPFPLEFLLGG
jgi:uncharacterized protein YdgA (DUF945 family)